jgi:hypothetical protein
MNDDDNRHDQSQRTEQQPERIPPVNVEALADRVYRLMMAELRVTVGRGASSRLP